jgi:hypothetical protein
VGFPLVALVGQEMKMGQQIEMVVGRVERQI